MSLSSGYYSTFRRDPHDGEDKKTRVVVIIWCISGHRSSDTDMERSYSGLEEDQDNNLAPDSPRLPTLDSLTMDTVIVNKSSSSKATANPNWYLLKRFGGEESKFSTYRPSIHRGGFTYTDAKIEGEC